MWQPKRLSVKEAISLGNQASVANWCSTHNTGDRGWFDYYYENFHRERVDGDSNSGS